MDQRYYFKCLYCERPFAVEIGASDLTETIRAIEKAACPLCNETAIKVMGRVEKKYLVKDGIKAACDARCTNAVGPHCDCVCGNENHGTHRLVVFSKIVGKLEVVNKDMLNNNEDYLARIKKLAHCKRNLIDMIKSTLAVKYEKVLAFEKEHGAYRMAWEDYEKYLKYRDTLRRIDKIESLRLVKRKVTELAKLYAGVR